MPAPRPGMALGLRGGLLLHTFFSVCGVWSQLHASREGKEVASEMAKLWETAASGNDIDMMDAKRLGGEVLEALLRTQLGVFFAANLGAAMCASLTLATKTLFLGQLTATETSKLTERLLKLMMLKVVFFGTVPTPTYSNLMQWLAWFALMAHASMFTQLASLRGDALLSSPSATLAQHARILLLLGGILAQDLSWIAGFLKTMPRDATASHAALWLFDPVLVAVDAAYSLAKYAVHAVEHGRAAQAHARGQEREPWEGRTAVVYWLDLASDLTLLLLSLAHYLHLWHLHGLQLQLVDGLLFLDCKYVMGAVARRVQRHLHYQRLQHQLQHSFLDATEQQLAEDPCPICLERMQAGKQLPCRHAVHMSCLCAWLQHSPTSGFTCPLCRADLDIQASQRRTGTSWQQRMGSTAHHLAQAPLALASSALAHLTELHQPAGPVQQRRRRSQVPGRLLVGMGLPRAAPPAHEREQHQHTHTQQHMQLDSSIAAPAAAAAAAASEAADAEYVRWQPNMLVPRPNRLPQQVPVAAGLASEQPAAHAPGSLGGSDVPPCRRITRLQARLAAAAAAAATAAEGSDRAAGAIMPGAGAVGTAAAAAAAAAPGMPAGPSRRAHATRYGRRIDGILDC